MKLCILGATGKTGKYVVDEALNRGFDLKLLVRTPEKLSSDIRSKHQIIKGDVLAYDVVFEAIQGVDAVIVLIGHTKNSPNDLQEKAIGNVLRAMQEQGIKRLIDLTGAGVSASEDKPKLLDTLTTKLLSIVDPVRLNDGESHVRLIKNSKNIDWTVARTGLQLSKSAKTPYKVGYVGDGLTTFRVSRSNIANFILDNLFNEEYLGKMPYISD